MFVELVRQMIIRFMKKTEHTCIEVPLGIASQYTVKGTTEFQNTKHKRYFKIKEETK